MRMPLLQLAQKNQTVWVVIGDTSNFILVDVESSQKMVVNSDCGLNRGLLCSRNLIVILCERILRF